MCVFFSEIFLELSGSNSLLVSLHKNFTAFFLVTRFQLISIILSALWFRIYCELSETNFLFFHLNRICKCLFCIFLNGLDYYNSNYHKSKTVKQLSQRAQLCCILLGLCASTAVTKVFEPICFFYDSSLSLAPMIFEYTAIMTFGLESIGYIHADLLQ